MIILVINDVEQLLESLVFLSDFFFFFFLMPERSTYLTLLPAISLL